MNNRMRSFANFFLIIFLADASMSVFDELLSLFFTASPLSGIRNFLASLVALVAVALYLCLGIDRRLPKRLFVPQTLFVFFCPLAFVLFPSLYGNHGIRTLLPAVQLALGLLPLVLFRNNGARCLIVPEALFEGTFFSLKNTLVFGAVNLFLVPLALAAMAFQTASNQLAESTSGFMRLTPTGIYMSERVYRRGNRTIRLAGMIHIGDKEYYDDLTKSASKGRTIILAEGVTDKRNRLENKPDYRKLAGFLGLTSQEKMRYRGNVIEAEELEAPHKRPQGEDKPEPEQEQADILRADVDASSFRPQTVFVLDAVGKHLRGSSSPAKGLLTLNSWGEKHVTPEMYQITMEDILQRRNKVVLGHLWKALATYDTVVIPWGALHMREIEAKVLERGFVLQEERKRRSVDFIRMFFG